MVGRVFGTQSPRFIHRPADVVENEAADAVQFAAEVGMPLDPWQQTTLEAWLGVRADGSWAATSAGIVVARQNGKNAILEARELAGLFLFGETRMVHSAHEAKTAREAFKRMRVLIESTPWLDAEVAQMPKAPGQEAVVLRSGAELSYRTRTKGGGRGFSAPVVIFDEAQELTGEQLAAIQPLVSSFPRRQLIYTGTVLAGASVFQGVVERGRKGLSRNLGYTEWSASESADPADPVSWLQESLNANPSVGYRMTVEAIEDEWETAVAAHTQEQFFQERWSVWPEAGGIGSAVPVDAWSRCETQWRPERDVTGGAVAVAVSIDRRYAAVGYCVPGGRDPFGEVIAQTGERDMRTNEVRDGIDWVLPYLVGLQGRRRPTAVVVDKAGPAFPLVNGMVAAGLPVRVAEFADWKAACVQFVDAVVVGRFEHPGQTLLTEAAHAVRWRDVGDSKVFDRKTPGVLVAPLEAVTLARWGLVGTARKPSKYESGDLLVLG